MTNEAAERLVERIKAATGVSPHGDKRHWDALVDAALDAERRATVERCRDAAYGCNTIEEARHWLDEEAAR